MKLKDSLERYVMLMPLTVTKKVKREILSMLSRSPDFNRF
jgi:hypothetical protein